MNVVVIMTDQQRADVSAREGFPLDTTPYIDDLARRGTWFDKAYTTMPACAPARVSFLTGRYPTATRVRTNHNLEDATYTRDLFDVMRENGYATVVLDNLCRGWKDLVLWGEFVNGDVNDEAVLKKIFETYQITSVVHLAGYAYVGESVVQPQEYWNNNFVASFKLFRNCVTHGVRRVIFSSTCYFIGDLYFVLFQFFLGFSHFFPILVV